MTTHGIVMAKTATLRCPWFVSAGATNSATSARPDTAMYQRGIATRAAISSRRPAARLDAAAAGMSGKYRYGSGCQARVALAGEFQIGHGGQLGVHVRLHHLERGLRQVRLDVRDGVGRHDHLVAADVGVERRVEDALLGHLPRENEPLDAL